MSDITIPIENVTPRGDWGYIFYRPSDGAILVGKTGDSDWIEIPKEIADLFGFDRLAVVSSKERKDQP